MAKASSSKKPRYGPYERGSQVYTDLLNEDFITPVRTQVGEHCWAITAIDVIKMAYKKKFGKDISLSIQELINHCSQTNPGFALQYMVDHGVGSEEACPYVGGAYKKNAVIPEGPKFKIKGYGKLRELEHMSEKLRDKEIGPLIVYSEVGFRARGLKGERKWDIYQPNPDVEKLERHAYIIVGEGIEAKDDDILEYFIVKSSWGERWAVLGYGRILKSTSNAKRAWYPILGEDQMPELHLIS